MKIIIKTKEIELMFDDEDMCSKDIYFTPSHTNIIQLLEKLVTNVANESRGLEKND